MKRGPLWAVVAGVGLIALSGCAEQKKTGCCQCSSGVCGLPGDPLMGGAPQIPEWVEMPAWYEDGPIYTYDRDTKGVVTVAAKVCRRPSGDEAWTAIPSEGYAILPDSEVQRLLEGLESQEGASVMTSPRLAARNNLQAGMITLARGETESEGETGTVFWVYPHLLDDGRVDLEFTFQCRGTSPVENGEPLVGTSRTTSRATLGVGQWYAAQVKGDFPSARGEQLVLLWNIASVEPEAGEEADRPAEPVM